MKAAIIIPFRDLGDGERTKQFDILSERIHKICIKNNQNYKIIIVNQNDNQLFNRAQLINAAVNIIKDECHYLILHDVDNIPITDDNVYKYRKFTGNICGIIDGKHFTNQDDHFGDVVFFKKEDFFAINGFSNLYWGWGFECSNTPLRLKNKEIVFKRHDGIFKTLTHETKYRFNGNSNFVNNLIVYNLIEMKLMEGYNESKYELTGIELINKNASIYHINLPQPLYDITRNITKEEVKQITGECNEELYDWVIKTYDK